MSAATASAVLIRPVGLQLSRTRGFRLHQASHALNGLPARRVDRATPYGNPFRFQSDEGCFVFTVDEETDVAGSAARLVALFRCWALAHPDGIALMARARRELRGCNLACWCGLEKPCHRDVLLEIVNADA